MSLTTKKSLGILAGLAERLPEHRRAPCDTQLLCLGAKKNPMHHLYSYSDAKRAEARSRIGDLCSGSP